MTGTDLRVIRKSLGMSQAELAAALDMTQPSISRLENEDWPISRVLELAVEHLQSLKLSA